VRSRNRTHIAWGLSKTGSPVRLLKSASTSVSFSVSLGLVAESPCESDQAVTPFNTVGRASYFTARAGELRSQVVGMILNLAAICLSCIPVAANNTSRARSTLRAADDSQKLLPWRGSTPLRGANLRLNYEINNVTKNCGVALSPGAPLPGHPGPGSVTDCLGHFWKADPGHFFPSAEGRRLPYPVRMRSRHGRMRSL
jgi:hypothetical protein